MVLSGQEIRKLNILAPFREKYKVGEISGGLGSASYDIALDQDTTVYVRDGFVLASTEEHFTMPNNVCAVVHDKSTWARCGLSVLNTFIDPGWKGYLTLELTSYNVIPLEFKKGTPIAQIVFSYVNEVPEKLYDGKYQNQLKGITKPII